MPSAQILFVRIYLVYHEYNNLYRFVVSKDDDIEPLFSELNHGELAYKLHRLAATEKRTITWSFDPPVHGSIPPTGKPITMMHLPVADRDHFIHALYRWRSQTQVNA